MNCNEKKSANFLALPGLKGEAAWAVGKSRSGKKLAAVAKAWSLKSLLGVENVMLRSGRRSQLLN